MARVLGVKVVELFFAPGRTAAERVVLGLLEGNGKQALRNLGLYA